MRKFLYSLLLLSICMPSLALGEEFHTAYNQTENVNPDSGYPKVDNFFEGKQSKDGFFKGKNLSNSSMFEAENVEPGFNSVEDSSPNEVKQYGLEVRHENEKKKVNKENPENSVKEEEKPKISKKQEKSDSLNKLDSSIKKAEKVSTKDPRVNSAIKASRDIREAIFGKQVVEVNEETGQKIIRKDQESVRF